MKLVMLRGVGRAARWMVPAMLLVLFASPALADPCKAIPDKGPMPSYLSLGAKFGGTVVYIADGDGLCVARGRSEQDWIEVRLGDFYAPELSEPGGQQAKEALRKLVFGRHITCVAGRRTYDRVAAICRLNGVSLGDLMRRAGVKEGGRGRR